MIPVVSTSWITSSINRRKQANVRPHSPDPRMIFSEVVVSCGDLPVMDKESICGATMALGGQESKDVNRLTTHICTLSMDNPKVKIAQERGWSGKIVLPHWYVKAQTHNSARFSHTVGSTIASSLASASMSDPIPFLTRRFLE